MKCSVLPITCVDKMRLFTFTVLMLITAYAHADAAVRVILHEQALVNARDVVLGEIAEIRGSDQGLIANLKSVRITESPLPGHTRSISDRTIRSVVVRTLGKDKSAVLIEGATQVQVKAQAQTIASQRLLDMARAELQSHLAGIAGLKMDVVGVIRDQSLPLGKITLASQRITTGMQLRQGVQIEIKVDDATVTRVPVWFAIDGSIDVPVARHDLSALQILNDALIEQRRVNLHELHGQLPLVVSQWSTRMTATPIKSGERLDVANTRVATDVIKDAAVTVVVQSGPITITTTARALANAMRGETVALVNTNSNEKFQGRVIGPGMVKGI